MIEGINAIYEKIYQYVFMELENLEIQYFIFSEIVICSDLIACFNDFKNHNKITT
jgi:hypothetical protein